MTFNEGDRWNGRKRTVVNNPDHGKRLTCPGCGKPAWLKPGEKYCFWCQVGNDLADRLTAEVERNDADDNSPARQRPEGY